MKQLADTAAIAKLLDVTPNTVRIIACRHPDQLPRYGKDHHGRTLYAIEDAERIAETRRAKARTTSSLLQ